MSAPTDDAVGRVAKELDRQRSWGGMAWVDAPRVSVPTDALRAVLARLAECEADQRRLDWLASKGAHWICRDSVQSRGWRLHQAFSASENQKFVNPRTAIDHAMRRGANG